MCALKTAILKCKTSECSLLQRLSLKTKQNNTKKPKSLFLNNGFMPSPGVLVKWQNIKCVRLHLGKKSFKNQW